LHFFRPLRFLCRFFATHPCSLTQGTGRGGTSIYGDRFDDEIHPELRFTGAGILAMANSGPNTFVFPFYLSFLPPSI